MTFLSNEMTLAIALWHISVHNRRQQLRGVLEPPVERELHPVLLSGFFAFSGGTQVKTMGGNHLSPMGEAARQFDVPISKLRRLIQKGEIRVFVDGRDQRRRLVRLDEVAAALAPREEQAA